jgi:excisionase family DNA binding protein
VLSGVGLGQTRHPLLMVKEVAQRLGVNPATVYKLIADGRLAHVRVLNMIRVAPEAIDKLLKGAMVAPKESTARGDDAE